jgi:hypothetical protein
MNQMSTFHTKSILLHVLLGILISTTLISCSKKPKEATEGAKSRVAQVSMEYLRLCFLGNMEHINSYVLLSQYLKNRDITLDEYTAQINQLPRRWSIEEHPVLQLILLEVDVKDNKGSVFYQRGGTESSFPRIRIDLEWSGNSWVIVNDTIFGNNGLFQK